MEKVFVDFSFFFYGLFLELSQNISGLVFFSLFYDTRGNDLWINPSGLVFLYSGLYPKKKSISEMNRF